MNMIKLLVMVFMVLKGLGCYPLFACSVGGSYLKPPNYDLVKETEAIVLAKAVSCNRYEVKERSLSFSMITFIIIDKIKGNNIKTGDSLVFSGDDNYLRKSNENDFSTVRPGAFKGGCNANDYKVEKKYLLFINKTKKGWSLFGPPFSRINEEVTSNESPWVVAVRHYVRISGLNDYEKEKSELRILRKTAKSGKDASKYPLGLVKDIDAYFTSPYPSKSYQDLVAIYEKSNKEGRRKVLWAIAQGKHSGAKPFIDGLIKDGKFNEYIGQICEYVKNTKDKNYVKELFVNYKKIKEGYARLPIIWTLIEIADENDTGIMIDILKSSTDDEADKIAVWFVKYPSKEAMDIIKRRIGGNYKEKIELSLCLAGMGDEDVLKWAEDIIDMEGSKRWVGYHIIARSPLAEADKIAKAIIKNNETENVVALLQGYDESCNPNMWERLRDILNLKNKDAEVTYWLEITLESLDRKGNSKATELLGYM